MPHCNMQSDTRQMQCCLFALRSIGNVSTSSRSNSHADTQNCRAAGGDGVADAHQRAAAAAVTAARPAAGTARGDTLRLDS